MSVIPRLPPADSFSWDYEDRMTSATVGATTWSYAYRGDGLRDSATTGATTRTFTWDVNAGLPVILDDGPSGEGYVYGAGVTAQVSGANTSYYLADGLGSTMGTTFEHADSGPRGTPLDANREPGSHRAARSRPIEGRRLSSPIDSERW